MIKRMINRQYDQLLEMCKQAKREIEYLDQDLLGGGRQPQLEIEKMEALIGAIERDIQVKKKEMNSLILKNRYEQLVSLYKQTQHDVQLLEATLGNDTLDDETDQQDGCEALEKNAQAKVAAPAVRKRTTHERLNLNVADVPHLHEGQDKDVVAQTKRRVTQRDDVEKKQADMLMLPPVSIKEQLRQERLLLKDKYTTTKDALPENIPQMPVAKEIVVESELIVSQKDEDEHIHNHSEIELPVAPLPDVLKPSDDLIREADSFNSLMEAVTQEAPLSVDQDQVTEQVPANKKFKGFSIFLNVMLYTVLMSLILVAFIIGMYRHTPDHLPRIFLGYSIMRVATGSMHPALRMNTVIVTRLVDPASLEVGEIVTFMMANDRTITHRIHAIYENYQNLGIYGFRLIGDANNGIPDDVVHHGENLIGRVVYHSYPLGQALTFVYDHFFFIIVGFVIGFVMLWLAKLRIKRIKKV